VVGGGVFPQYILMSGRGGFDFDIESVWLLISVHRMLFFAFS
jgi:hypothetical protein